MHRTLTVLSSLVLVSAVGAMGCSSKSSPAPSGGCPSKTVSFSKDVAPAFIASGCSLSAVCHGQPNLVGEEDLFLGATAPAPTTDPKTIYAGLVGVMSKEDPDMPLVDAMGSTANSYLWHKIVGDQNMDPSTTAGCMKMKTSCGSDCTAMPPCGAAMPDTGDALMLEPGEQDNFCAIQDWIQQGAKND